MMQFKVTFHRYRNGESRLSAPSFIQADSFSDATTRAMLMRSAMAEVDLSSVFLVASIDTVGLRGDVCTVGWETEAEFSERVQKEQR